MAGAACKVIINNGSNALRQGLEKILMHPLVRDEMLSAHRCDELIQRMADNDLIAYNGGTITPGISLGGIMEELQNEGVVTEEVWGIYAKPDHSRE